MKTFLKPLSLAEERHYLEQCQKGDPQAKNILIEHNLRLVAHVVKKYQGGGQELDDLISIGAIGLIKAITTFDPSKSPRLSTYAARCIDNAILSQIRESPKSNTPGKQKNRNGKSGAGIRKAGERALTGLLTCFLFY